MGRVWCNSDFGFKPIETVYTPDKRSEGVNPDVMERFFTGDYDIVIRTGTIDHPRCVIFTKMVLSKRTIRKIQYRIIFKRRYILRSKYILEKRTNDDGWEHLSEIYYNSNYFEDNIESLMSELIRRARTIKKWRLFEPHKGIF